MKKSTCCKIILCVFVFAAISAQSQNVIQNGTAFTDSNGDGLADYWSKGYLTGAVSVDTGYQYAYSNSGTCSQSSIFQVLNIANTTPKKYLIEFDSQANTDLWCIVNYNANVGSMVLMVNFTDAGWGHYSAVYNQFNTSNWNIYSIQFCCPNGGENWLYIDNVTMTEIITTGIEKPLAVMQSPPDGIYSLYGQKLTRPPRNQLYVEVKESVITKKIKH